MKQEFRNTEDYHLEPQGEDSHLYNKEEGLGRNEPCLHVDSGLLAPGKVRKSIPDVYGTESMAPSFGNPTTQTNTMTLLTSAGESCWLIDGFPGQAAGSHLRRHEHRKWQVSIAGKKGVSLERSSNARPELWILFQRQESHQKLWARKWWHQVRILEAWRQVRLDEWATRPITIQDQSYGQDGVQGQSWSLRTKVTQSLCIRDPSDADR